MCVCVCVCVCVSECDDGVVSRAKHFTVAYLPQESSALVSGRSLYEEAAAQQQGVDGVGGGFGGFPILGLFLF